MYENINVNISVLVCNGSRSTSMRKLKLNDAARDVMLSSTSVGYILLLPCKYGYSVFRCTNTFMDGVLP